MSLLKLSKFDVAERQILQAIRMFFAQEDPVSIHTLAEASAQVLKDIGGEYGAKSILRDNDVIRDDMKKEWIKIISSSKNFFKHADRDKNELHEFRLEFNDFSIFDAVNMHYEIKKKWVPETLTFITWMATEHPSIFKDQSEFANHIKREVERGDLQEIKDKGLLLEAIKAMRADSGKSVNICVDYGL